MATKANAKIDEYKNRFDSPMGISNLVLPKQSKQSKSKKIPKKK